MPFRVLALKIVSDAYLGQCFCQQQIRGVREMSKTSHVPKESSCRYPVEEINNFFTGPVLSHAAAVDRLREQNPFMRSTHESGYWVFTDGKLILEALQNPDIFSSSVVTPLESDPPYKWIPEMLDPPEHTTWRQLLAPHFAPKPMSRLEDKVRQRCIDLVDSFASSGHCDFLRDFAWRYPTTIFMELMGLPIEGLDQFLAWEHEILHQVEGADPDHSKAFTAMLSVMEYFTGLIE